MPFGLSSLRRPTAAAFCGIPLTRSTAASLRVAAASVRGGASLLGGGDGRSLLGFPSPLTASRHPPPPPPPPPLARRQRRCQPAPPPLSPPPNHHHLHFRPPHPPFPDPPHATATAPAADRRAWHRRHAPVFGEAGGGQRRGAQGRKNCWWACAGRSSPPARPVPVPVGQTHHSSISTGHVERARTSTVSVSPAQRGVASASAVRAA